MLLGTGIEHTMQMRHLLASALGKRPRTKSSAWPTLMSWIYRKSGMKFIAPRWGSSIYAYFKKV
jgi:hypothetical protein